jgi:hypothetical protein
MTDQYARSAKSHSSLDNAVKAISGVHAFFPLLELRIQKPL